MNKEPAHEPEHEPLTKLEALKWTWIGWRDVAESYIDDETGMTSPDNVVNKYSVMRSYGKKFAHSCPCCEYVRGILDEADCIDDICPLMDVWGSGMEYACELHLSSPYRLYECSLKLNVEYQAARQIADGAWELYLKECEAQGATPVDKFFTPITDKT